MYEMPLDELLQKLEARGIDTSKITLKKMKIKY